MPDDTAPHIMVHDFVGHPFTAELARGLGALGGRVDYVFFPAEGGPKGRNARTEGDPEGISFFGLTIDRPYSKTNFIKRRFGDVAYGASVGALIRERRPDVVISVAAPDAHGHIIAACREVGAKFIFWCQDIYSVAITKIMRKKLPVLGGLIGAYYTYLERRQMRMADHIVHITDRFTAQTDAWSIPRDKVTVIPNWAALDQIPCLDRDTDWAAAQGLDPARLRVVYSGTLALKHNPDLLLELARQCEGALDVVVIGFGVGHEYLKTEGAGLSNLIILPLQEFSALPQVLASGDVLVATIEADAGEFSVPSKVLSYLCAGRPVVLAAPASNLATETVLGAQAGAAVEPEDIDGFVSEVRKIASDPELRATMGKNARAYAEDTFDITRISQDFDALFRQVLGR